MLSTETAELKHIETDVMLYAVLTHLSEISRASRFNFYTSARPEDYARLTRNWMLTGHDDVDEFELSKIFGRRGDEYRFWRRLIQGQIKVIMDGETRSGRGNVGSAMARFLAAMRR